MSNTIGVFNLSEGFTVDSSESPNAFVPNTGQSIDLDSGFDFSDDMFNDGITLEEFDFNAEQQPLEVTDVEGTPIPVPEVSLGNPDDKDWQDEVISIAPQPTQQAESNYISDIQTRLNTTSSNNPIYLGENYTTTGEFSIESRHLRSFYENAIHLDRKDSKVYITLVAVNNYCFIYSLNIGIELTAFFGCDYDGNVPLIVTLPINKILKLLNTDEPVRFIVEEDEFLVKKTKMSVSLGKPDLMYSRECDTTINEMYAYYDTSASDELNNNMLKSMLTVLSPYSRMNKADSRLILLDSKIAYVKSTGYYVFQNFKTNKKYIINNLLSQLLIKLSDVGITDDYNIRIIATDDTYIVLSNNYMLKFPILNGEFKFNLIGKIQPTAVYSVDKKEFKTALDQIDLYTEKRCAIVLGDTPSLQNKTVQGTAYVEISLDKLEDSRESQTQSVYEFDYNKLVKVIAPLKTDNIVLMECNTREHLYLTDQKMSYYIILSVK